MPHIDAHPPMCENTSTAGGDGAGAGMEEDEMMDLETAAVEMNSKIEAAGVKLVFCTAGKRTLKFWKRAFVGDTSGYGISKAVARSYGVPA